MGLDWYNMIAKRMGGYVKNWNSTKEGLSGEDVFETELIDLIRGYPNVLDAGCGHGDFTIKMAKFTNSIVGFDFSEEMVKIAKGLMKSKDDHKSVEFYYARTTNLPFQNEQFDLIYSRRGPTSVIYDKRLLKPSGIIIGIHSQEKEKVLSRLHESDFREIEIQEYVAYEYFPTKLDFAKFLSRMPGSPNYLDDKYKKEFEELVKKHSIERGLYHKEYRYIWRATKL